MINYQKILDTVISLAIERHAGQLDKAGKPYILHPLHVMCDELCKSYELKIIAICHDLLEDTDTTAEELLALGVPSDLVDCIKMLSKPKGTDYFVYLERLVKYDSVFPTIVKLADLRHNMDISRIPNPTEKDYARREKYKKAEAFIVDYLKSINYVF